MISRLATTVGLLVVGLAMATPAEGQSSNCTQSCVTIRESNVTIGFGCISGTAGFNCHADINGCDIERTGCTSGAESETEQSTDEVAKALHFDQGLLRNADGDREYVLVPCPVARRSLFVVAATAMEEFVVGMGESSVR